MKQSSPPRLRAGIHTGGLGAAGGERRKKGFFGGREPVRWEDLFPRNRTGVRRGLCCIGAVTLLLAGGVLLWISARDGSPHPDGGDPPLSGGVPTDTAPPFSDEETSRETSAPSRPPATDTAPDTAPPTDTEPPEETGDGETAPEETAAPPDTPEDGDPPTETTPPEEQAPSVPEGCYPIVSVDVSESRRGSGYLTGETDGLPATLPPNALWTGDTPPAVLLVHTHPLEGYGDGKAWYDPAAGGMAQTDTPNDPEGVVALGAALARDLRERGVTVMHLRIAVSEEDTAAAIYDRTRAAVRSYLTLYPDIGLILDLRRSAELTEEGGILRTAGDLNGETCAQLRISVSAHRPANEVKRDLSAALALRETLWQISPTVARPVWVKSGGGIAGDGEGVSALTLELGSAGNTFGEAAALIPPLAECIARLVSVNTSP